MQGPLIGGSGPGGKGWHGCHPRMTESRTRHRRAMRPLNRWGKGGINSHSPLRSPFGDTPR
ncbi:hypothetical protein [Azospirillum endophyticum]